MTTIGHFRVRLSLHFKARLSAKSLLWKSVFIHIEIGTNYHNKNFALRLALKRDLGELGNGLFQIRKGTNWTKCYLNWNNVFIVATLAMDKNGSSSSRESDLLLLHLSMHRHRLCFIRKPCSKNWIAPLYNYNQICNYHWIYYLLNKNVPWSINCFSRALDNERFPNLWVVAIGWANLICFLNSYGLLLKGGRRLKILQEGLLILVKCN